MVYIGFNYCYKVNCSVRSADTAVDRVAFAASAAASGVPYAVLVAVVVAAAPDDVVDPQID